LRISVIGIFAPKTEGDAVRVEHMLNQRSQRFAKE
jgi:hypothetical protein